MNENKNEIVIPVIVTVCGNTDKFVSDADIKGVIVNYNDASKQMRLTIPETKKVDRSPNPSLYAGSKTSLTINLHKDGNLGASGKFSKKKVIEAGEEMLHNEFLKAADAIWAHFGQ